jgi:hypothetical protein
MAIDLGVATHRGARGNLFDGQARQRDHRADLREAADLAQVRKPASSSEPADAGNALQAPPNGLEFVMLLEMGFDLAFGLVELLLQLRHMPGDLLADPVGHAPRFLPVALLTQHVLDIVAIGQQSAQGKDGRGQRFPGARLLLLPIARKSSGHRAGRFCCESV